MAKTFDATLKLLGLRYDKETIDRLFIGVTQLMESSTFNGLLEQGEVRGRHLMLLRFGRKKLGPVSAEAESALKSITDVARLERLIDTLDDAADWQAWLQA